MKKQTFGIIVTTRGFFPSHLVKTARENITKVLDSMDYSYVMVGEKDTQNGAIVSYEESKICAELFQKNRNKIDGIIVILPNFGEELGVADAIEMAGLDVPVLVQACDDDWNKMDMANRRDAFCGKLSLCNNFYQRDIRYSLTKLHTCEINSDDFRADILKFAGVCRVVNGIKGSRIAMLGARPIAFNTVRFSEKILQKHKIAVQTVDFSEIIFKAMSYDNQEKIDAKKAEIKAYGNISTSIGDDLIERQAKLCNVLEETVEALDCDASTVQCWDSVENNYGCATCLGMSMMGDKGKPSACESDVTGAVSMLAASLAAGTAPALMDWNNNIREERNTCVSLHCSNFPKSFFASEIEIESLDVLGSTLGKENCFGACKGQVAPGDMTYFRVTTDDQKGVMKAYLGEGRFQEEVVPTKGGVANCYVPELQKLMQYMCKNGYEHHVCFVRGKVADILEEAFINYMGVEVYRHS